MNSILLTYPNVTLVKAVSSRSGTGFEELKEVVNKEYGYELTIGQELYCIRYKGSNAEMYVQPKVIDIQEDGILIRALNINSIRFIPFKKSLPNAEVFEDRDMCIEPCGWLFFTNEKLQDIKKSDLNFDEIWYRHGGWKTRVENWSNLNRFIKLGQLEIGAG